MRRNLAIIALLLTCTGVLGGAQPLPQKVRVAAAVAGRWSAPDDAPLKMPTDVAVDSRGRVWVADGVNNRVVGFDAEGRVVSVVSSAGETPLKRPAGLCVDGKDQLWIADTGNARLVVVAADGSLDATIDVPSELADHPTDATDVAVTPDGGRAYVIDNDNHRVLVRDNASGKWSALGRRGRALGRFQYPFTVAIDRAGTVYVCEAMGARVQKITPDGKWAGMIGTWGVRAGQFYRPKGVAIDPAGRVFVSDSTTGTVQVFTHEGELVGALADGQGNPLRFEHPMGLAVGPKGRLYVVEMRADRVAVVDVKLPDAEPLQPPTTQPDEESSG